MAETVSREELIYELFWKQIIEKDGKIDLDQLKKELCDYHTVLSNASKVYDAVSGGTISDPLVNPRTAISIIEEYQRNIDG